MGASPSSGGSSRAKGARLGNIRWLWALIDANQDNVACEGCRATVARGHRVGGLLCGHRHVIHAWCVVEAIANGGSHSQLLDGTSGCSPQWIHLFIRCTFLVLARVIISLGSFSDAGPVSLVIRTTTNLDSLVITASASLCSYWHVLSLDVRSLRLHNTEVGRRCATTFSEVESRQPCFSR